MVFSNTAIQNCSLPVVCTDKTVILGKCNVCAQAKHFAEILFDYCPDCNKYDMPALPQSAFAVHKIRANMQKNMTVSTVHTGEKQPDNRLYPNKKLMDYTPVKYNSKFMNAIWGHYNRYSPHNIKSNEADAPIVDCYQQQQCYIAAAGYDIVKNMSINGAGWEFRV